MNDSFTNFEDFYKTMLDFDALSNLLETFKPTDYNDFEYQGFNVSQLAETFWNGSKSLSKSEALKDLQDMIAIGLMRANIRKDQLAKTSKKGVDRINVLVERYGIPVKKNVADKVELGPGTLTFVRLLSVFPINATVILHKKPSLLSRVVSYKFEGDKCPIPLRHAGAASIIPQGTAGSYYLNAHIAYMMDVGMLIDQRNMTNLERYENQRRFAMIANNSNTVSQAKRVGLFKALGLNQLSVFEKVLVCVNCIRKIRDKSIVSSVKDTTIVVISDKIQITEGVTEEETDEVANALTRSLLKDSLPVKPKSPGPSGVSSSIADAMD